MHQQTGIRSRTDYRQGPGMGGARPLSFADVRRRFDFRSIRIGRWVSAAEQDRACGLFHDALVDLMQILGGPESLISLRGTLSLEYGIGGRPGVSAHYTPGSRSFSLAKNAGPGSIAHEWFHALDHYLGTKAFSDTSPAMFASSAWLADATPVVHPLNDRLFGCFRALMLAPGGDQPSDLFRASAAMDRTLGTTYYSRPEELAARAFEAFVEDAPIRNSFLVAGSRHSQEAKQGLYPRGAERERINAAFTAYFSGLGAALGREA